VVLSAFLPLYYLGKDTPKQLLLSNKLVDKKIIASALSTQIIDAPQKDKRHFLKIRKADKTTSASLPLACCGKIHS
jgi:excinuclease ABC subunit C